ncbi:sodium:solute symporter [Shivajiella indica]|uniref:Sodium:solute symporter n=1 Tax=Shivajiella indica TaxID=872115 RepID=A0ABW5B5H0_9BACT
MELSLIDLAIFFVYMAGIVGFGVSFYFKNRTGKDYITGGGRLPAWALGMSIFATYVSSISFLALPGNAYQSNWNSFVFSLSIPFAALIAVNFFVPLYRKLQSPSAYTYFENRFGPWVRIYASICYLLTQLARMGAILYLLALPMEALLGWNIPTIIVLTGLLVMIYAMMGGIEAVVWTDAIQGIILISGAIGCLFLIILRIPGGIDQVLEIAKNDHKLSLGSFSLNWSESTFWLVLIYGLFINLQNFGVDQSYIQRYIGARSEKEAKLSTWLGSLLYVPVSLLFFMIGTALYVYYQINTQLLPIELSGLDQADKIFPYFIVSSLPVGLTGLLVASIFAAGMSTLSTSINSSATVILEDHFKKYLSSSLPQQSEISILRTASFAMGLASIGVALAFNGVLSALDAWWALASIFSGGILGLFLLGILTKIKSNLPPVLGVILGLIVIGWISLSDFFQSLGFLSLTIHKNLAIVLGTTAIFFVGFFVGHLIKPFKKP